MTLNGGNNCFKLADHPFIDNLCLLSNFPKLPKPFDFPIKLSRIFLQLMVRCAGLEKKSSRIIVGDVERENNVSIGSIHKNGNSCLQTKLSFTQ